MIHEPRKKITHIEFPIKIQFHVPTNETPIGQIALGKNQCFKNKSKYQTKNTIEIQLNEPRNYLGRKEKPKER